MAKNPKVDELRGNENWLRRVGTAIRTAREAAGLTQTELAVRSGVQYGTISRLETFNRTPMLPVLEALADALFIPLDQLVGRAVPQPESVGDRLPGDERAALQRLMQAEIDSFLRALPPERLRELARPATPQPANADPHEPEPRPKVVFRRRAPRPE